MRHGPTFIKHLWEDSLSSYTRMIKRYNALEPSAKQALAHAAASDAGKTQLRDMLGDADPLLLLAEIRAAPSRLGMRVDERARR